MVTGGDSSPGCEAHPPLWGEDKGYAIREFAQFRKAAGSIMILLKEIWEKTKYFKDIPSSPGMHSGRHRAKNLSGEGESW